MDGMKKPRCEDCKFFAADDHQPDQYGECRRRAPAGPRVNVDLWCGEWRSIQGEEFYLWDHPEIPFTPDP